MLPIMDMFYIKNYKKLPKFLNQRTNKINYILWKKNLTKRKKKNKFTLQRKKYLEILPTILKRYL